MLSPITIHSSAEPILPQPTQNVVAPYLQPQPPQSFPDMTANYQTTVAIPAQQAAQAAAKAAQDALEAQQAAEEAQAAQSAYAAPTQPVDSLTGSLGYSLPYGNCVDMAVAYGKEQPGNPISWVPSTLTPFIGAAALFPFNHVGVVVGLWGNGDVEIAQENAPGMDHRFPVSEFRGFF